MAEINLSELNRRVKETPEELIRRSEGRYHAYIGGIAERVAADDNIKVILVAGPSASGKTTTANLIADAITANGRASFVVSLDNFYRNSEDPLYPHFEDGTRDYESVDALCIDDIVKTLTDISKGKEYMLPRFDFKVGGRVEEKIHPANPQGCVVIEGIHALNPRIFSCLPAENILKIFISASTNILDDEGRRILSGRKVRFMRRLVRDSLYRGTDIRGTLAMWDNVLHGEDKYLYPFKGNADVAIDTFHFFELAVMRPFVLRAIDTKLLEESSYVRTVYNAIVGSETLSEKFVPQNSLIREFIPGGIYEALY